MIAFALEDLLKRDTLIVIAALGALALLGRGSLVENMHALAFAFMNGPGPAEDRGGA